MQLLAYVGAVLDEARAWDLIRELARRARAGSPVQVRAGFVVDTAGRLEEVPAERAQLVIEPGEEPCFQSASRLAPAVRQLLELYLPLCIGAGAENAANEPANRIEQLFHRFFRALGGQLCQAGREPQKLEQRAQDRDIELLRCLDVLELLQIVERSLDE